MLRAWQPQEIDHDPRPCRIADYPQPNDGEPIRSVVHASADAAIVAWTVKPGQRSSPHVHPTGQGTWAIIAGAADCQVDADGRTVRIVAGDVVVAPTRAVHGVLNSGAECISGNRLRPPDKLLDVLDLFAHLLDQHLHVDRDPRQLQRGGL